MDFQLPRLTTAEYMDFQLPAHIKFPGSAVQGVFLKESHRPY